ncbi:hypothetical protein C7212DRAFT_210439, partial [Tuber magnatum]
DTRLAQKYAVLFSPNEWYWIDSGYPIESWLITSYTIPTSPKRDNKTFNYYFLTVHTRSKHTIGYLQG